MAAATSPSRGLAACAVGAPLMEVPVVLAVAASEGRGPARRASLPTPAETADVLSRVVRCLVPARGVVGGGAAARGAAPPPAAYTVRLLPVRLAETPMVAVVPIIIGAFTVTRIE